MGNRYSDRNVLEGGLRQVASLNSTYELPFGCFLVRRNMYLAEKVLFLITVAPLIAVQRERVLRR